MTPLAPAPLPLASLMPLLPPPLLLLLLLLLLLTMLLTMMTLHPLALYRFIIGTASTAQLLGPRSRSASRTRVGCAVSRSSTVTSQMMAHRTSSQRTATRRAAEVVDTEQLAESSDDGLKEGILGVPIRWEVVRCVKIMQ